MIRKIGVSARMFHVLPHLKDVIRDTYPAAEIVYGEVRAVYSPEEVTKFFAGCDAAVISLERFTEEVLTKLPDLKVVACCSAGVDHIDPALMKRHGIRVGWRPGVNRQAVAEMAVSLMIDLLRGISVYRRAMEQSGTWPVTRSGRLLRGRTVGIHGCGNIGREIVKLLQPFGCSILASDRADISDFCAEYGVESVGAEELRARAEILTLHLPRNRSTRGLYSAEILDQMMPGALLINTARGSIVDETALLARLQDGSIAAAAFDVFDEEPVRDRRLLSLENFLVTPHIGGSAIEAMEALGRSGIRGIEDGTVPEPGVYPFD
jgi:D-3-phosphoglycerate dehydrogenase / 2-oxoglutarate reductase